MITPIKVSEGIWRGPQVSGDDWKTLYALGIRTSLKLNYEDEGTDRSALDRGIAVVTVSMPPKDLIGALGKPDPKDIAAAVSHLAMEELRPIYCHCTHGQDRTGIVVGEYRVLHEGWTLDAAWREMLTLGFHWMLPDLMNTWMEFYIEHTGCMAIGGWTSMTTKSDRSVDGWVVLGVTGEGEFFPVCVYQSELEAQERIANSRRDAPFNFFFLKRVRIVLADLI